MTSPLPVTGAFSPVHLALGTYQIAKDRQFFHDREASGGRYRAGDHSPGRNTAFAEAFSYRLVAWTGCHTPFFFVPLAYRRTNPLWGFRATLCLETSIRELENADPGRIVTLPQSLDVTDFHPHVILDLLVGYVLTCLPGHEVP